LAQASSLHEQNLSTGDSSSQIRMMAQLSALLLLLLSSTAAAEKCFCFCDPWNIAEGIFNITEITVPACPPIENSCSQEACASPGGCGNASAVMVDCSDEYTPTIEDLTKKVQDRWSEIEAEHGNIQEKALDVGGCMQPVLVTCARYLVRMMLDYAGSPNVEVLSNFVSEGTCTGDCGAVYDNMMHCIDNVTHSNVAAEREEKCQQTSSDFASVSASSNVPVSVASLVLAGAVVTLSL